MTFILEIPQTAQAPLLSGSPGVDRTPRDVAVPDVRGREQHDAEQYLAGYGLSTVVEYVLGPGSEGQVCGQRPDADDDPVASGSTVRLFVDTTASAGTDVEARLDRIEQQLTALANVADTIAATVTSAAAAIERLDGGDVKTAAPSTRAAKAPRG